MADTKTDKIKENMITRLFNQKIKTKILKRLESQVKTKKKLFKNLEKAVRKFKSLERHRKFLRCYSAMQA